MYEIFIYFIVCQDILNPIWLAAGNVCKSIELFILAYRLPTENPVLLQTLIPKQLNNFHTFQKLPEGFITMFSLIAELMAEICAKILKDPEVHAWIKDLYSLSDYRFKKDVWIIR